MDMKLKVKGKVYTVVDSLPVIDEDIIHFKKLVKNSKGEEFYLVKSVLNYSLYTLAGKRVLDTYSIIENY
jgi:hypothetical protein